MSELVWRKSSYSDGGGGECVEVSHTPVAIHVRDSKRIQGPVVHLRCETWNSFLASLDPELGHDR